jgi:hypothetical protein
MMKTTFLGSLTISARRTRKDWGTMEIVFVVVLTRPTTKNCSTTIAMFNFMEYLVSDRNKSSTSMAVSPSFKQYRLLAMRYFEY